MPGRLPKTELQRYVDRLIFWNSIRILKWPQVWGFGLAMIGCGIVAVLGHGWIALGSFIASFLISARLFGRRLMADMDRTSKFQKISAANVHLIQRYIRNGSFELRVGAEACAILESCATSANLILAKFGTPRWSVAETPSGPDQVHEAFTRRLMKASFSQVTVSLRAAQRASTSELESLRTYEKMLADLRDWDGSRVIWIEDIDNLDPEAKEAAISMLTH